jgi:hypothetical protein
LLLRLDNTGIICFRSRKNHDHIFFSHDTLNGGLHAPAALPLEIAPNAHCLGGLSDPKVEMVNVETAVFLSPADNRIPFPQSSNT